MFILLPLITACVDEQIIQRGVKGELVGYVHSGSDFFETGPLQHVRVTIEGRNPELTVITDQNGKFRVSDLETGTYNLVFEKEGYGTHKIVGYAFIGGNQSPVVNSLLYRLPELKIKSLDVTVSKHYSIVALTGTILIDLPGEVVNQYGYYRYYIGGTEEVSPARYIESGVLVARRYASVQTFYLSFDLTKLQPGTSVYFIVYPCADATQGYVDPATGNIIYSSVARQGTQVIKLEIPN